MNYNLIYDNLIKKSQHRELKSENYEKHHIIPRCLGGTETTRLTLREHFIVHKLLIKINPNNYKLKKAFMMMSDRTKEIFGNKIINSRIYKTIKEEIRKELIGRKLLDTTKEKIRVAHKGKKLSESHKINISNSSKGRILSKETREKIGKSNSLSLKGNIPWNKGKKNCQKAWNKGIKIGEMSQENKEKISRANKGRRFSEEHKKNLSESAKKRKGTIPWNKGLKMSEEYKNKLRISHKGQIPWNKGLKIDQNCNTEEMSIIESTICKGDE